MSDRAYFTIAAAFFAADAVFHIIRLTAWWNVALVMEFPMWISPLAILFSGFFAWQGFKLARQSE